MPTQDDELKLSYYNSMATWVNIDSLLNKFGINREDLANDPAKVEQAVHDFSRRMPTYVTLKDVKKRWGNGQEDVHPVAQIEKLWGDMSSLDDVDCLALIEMLPILDRHLVGGVGDLLVALTLGLVGRSLGTAARCPLAFPLRIGVAAAISAVAAVSRWRQGWKHRGLAGRPSQGIYRRGQA